MALLENICDAQSMAVRTAHERCTTIVPITSMLRLPAAQTEDPSSRAMQQAANQKFDMSQIQAVVNCLSRVDGNTPKLKSTKKTQQPSDPVVCEVLNVLQKLKTDTSDVPVKKSKPTSARQEKPRPSLQSVTSFAKVSALKLHTRTSAPDFAQLGLLVTGDEERGVKMQRRHETPQSRDQLLKTFEDTFQTLLAVYQALASSGRLEDVVFSDVELQQLCTAFMSLNAVLDTTPASPLFGEDTVERLGEILHCCGQQAMSAMHDQLSTLHDDVEERKSIAIRAGLEALCVLLKLCSSPDCPRHLLDQDSMETCCKFLAQQTRCSLLVFFDTTLAIELRPDAEKSHRQATTSENRGKLTNAGAMVCDLVGCVVEGLRQLSYNVAIENPGFDGMMRTLARVLHIAPLSTLHSPIIDLFIRIYDATDEREGITAALDVMWMMIKPNIEAAMDGRPLKPCHLTTGTPICSLTLSILKLVQEVCRMPAIDAPENQINDFLKPVIQLCGDFWCHLLEQMNRNSSAPKVGKVLVIAIVDELIAAASQPEWPGAQLLLYVLCNHLKDVVHGGARLGKTEANAREEKELLLEVVGHLIAKMLALFKRSEDDNALLLRLVSAAGTDIQATEAGTMPEVTMAMMRQHEHLLQLLMHGWLQANSCLDTAGALSVRRCSAVFSLWCSLERVRANEAHAYNNTSPLACRPEDSVQSSVENAHQLMALKGSTAGATALLEAVQLTSAQAATAHKLILCGSLLERGLDVLLLRLTKASLASQESSMKVRASAWKALGEVLAVKPEILAVPIAQEALKSALSDKEKSAQVQDRALDILANHIRGDPAACRMHLAMVQQATRHNALSVRKRAVDIIWSCYISDETFSSSNRTLCNKLLLVQLQMFEDQEASMRAKVLEAFKMRWFLCEDAEAAATPAAELCMMLRTLHLDRAQASVLPLAHDHCLRKLLAAILCDDPETDKIKPVPKDKFRKAAVLIAEVLLGAVVDGVDEDSTAQGTTTQERDASFDGASLVILALESVDVSLIMSTTDVAQRGRARANPFRFFEALRMQLRSAPAELRASTEPAAMAQAETRIRALLLSVAMLLKEAERQGLAPAEASLRDIVEDAEWMLRTVPNVSIIQTACEVVARVALVSDEHGSTVFSYCENLHSNIVSALPNLAPNNPNRAKAEMPFRRKLIILSHLLRFLAPHPNITALQGKSFNYDTLKPGPVTTLPRALLGIVSNESSLPPACLDTTLAALMQLIIGFPAESNDLSSKVLPVLRKYLRPQTRISSLRKVIVQLCELVRVEEQQYIHAVGKDSVDPAEEKKAAAVAIVNGMNEGVSNAGAIIQSIWGESSSAGKGGLVYALLYPGPCASSLSSQENVEAVLQAYLVRKDGVELLGLVQRAGAVAPWQYLPPAVALSVDISPAIADSALRILKLAAAKADVMAYFANILSSGLEQALQFHEEAYASLQKLEALGINESQLPRCWPQYWPTVHSRFASGLFHSVIDLHRELRARFLSTIVAAADHATQACSDRGATPRRLKLLAFLSHLLAAVSLTSRDEVLSMLSKLNVFIARRAHSIESTVGDSLASQGSNRGWHPSEGSVNLRIDTWKTVQDAGQPPASAVQQQWRACTGMCIVLQLKMFLVQAYHIKEGMLQAYTSDAKKVEGTVDRSKAVIFALSANLDAAEQPSAMPAQFELFQQLLASDTDDYSVAHVATVSNKGKRRNKVEGKMDPDADTVQVPKPKRPRKSRKTKVQQIFNSSDSE